VKVPVLLVPKLTEPDGEVAPVAEVSVTAAEQVEDDPTIMGMVHATVVTVGCTVGGDIATGSQELFAMLLLASPE
jgi:hypothetical protein